MYNQSLKIHFIWFCFKLYLLFILFFLEKVERSEGLPGSKNTADLWALLTDEVHVIVLYFSHIVSLIKFTIF